MARTVHVSDPGVQTPPRQSIEFRPSLTTYDIESVCIAERPLGRGLGRNFMWQSSALHANDHSDLPHLDRSAIEDARKRDQPPSLTHEGGELSLHIPVYREFP
jgi:hypothetical protein